MGLGLNILRNVFLNRRLALSSLVQFLEPLQLLKQFFIIEPGVLSLIVLLISIHLDLFLFVFKVAIVPLLLRKEFYSEVFGLCGGISALSALCIHELGNWMALLSLKQGWLFISIGGFQNNAVWISIVRCAASDNWISFQIHHKGRDVTWHFSGLLAGHIATQSFDKSDLFIPNLKCNFKFRLLLSSYDLFKNFWSLSYQLKSQKYLFQKSLVFLGSEKFHILELVFLLFGKIS